MVHRAAPHPAGQEAAKLTARLASPTLTWVAVHLKPRYHAQVARELVALNLPGLEIGRAGWTYTF